MALFRTLICAGFLSSLVDSSPVYQRGSVNVVSTNGWRYEGCWAEGTSSRALMGASLFTDTMTVQACSIFCELRGFSLFGVEYGRECFCGNDIHKESYQDTDAACDFACAGAAAQSCGGSNRLNLYRLSTSASASSSTTASAIPAPTTYTARGCYSEATTGRALDGKSSVDDQQTIAKCANQCKGYKYFGLEYYFECFCGDQLRAGSASVADSDCSYPCTGDATETCGGSWRLSMYSFGDYPAPAVPVSTTSTHSPGPTSSSHSGYSTLGCFTDVTHNRALKGATYYDDAMTVEKCAVACGAWSIFGVEYGRECFCGNGLQGSVEVLAAQCNMPCVGNSAQTCGAGDRLNVYTFGAAVVSSATSSSVSSTASTSSSQTAPTSSTAEVSTTSSTVVISSSETTASTTTTDLVSSTPTPSSTVSETTTSTTASSTPTPITFPLNGGFEDGAVSWNLVKALGGDDTTTSISTNSPRSGLQGYRHYSPTTTAHFTTTALEQLVPIVPGKEYTVKIWIYLQAGNWCRVESLLQFSEMGNMHSADGLPRNSWTLLTGSTVLAEDVVSPARLAIVVRCSGAGPHELYLDDIELTFAEAAQTAEIN